MCAMWLQTLSAAQVYATCGDWLANTKMTEHEVESVLHESEAPVPCDGPGCREAPDAPVAPASLPRITTDEDRGCSSLDDAVGVSVPRSCWLRDKTLTLPEGCHLRVERPPRSTR